MLRSEIYVNSPAGGVPGAHQLRDAYQSNLARGLLLAAALHASGLALYWGLRALVPPSPGVRAIELTIETFQVPASLDVPIQPEPPQPPSGAVEMVAGTPRPVPVTVSERTIATQEQLRQPTTSSTGVAGIGPIAGGSEPVTAPTAAPPSSLPPTSAEPTVVEYAEQMPELIGGLQSIRPVYPELERRIGIEGRVIVRFVVIEDGSVVDVTVTRSVSPGLDRAAIEAVERARFRPGMQAGRPVRVRFSLPVNFRLN